jgi:uridine kinase
VSRVAQPEDGGSSFGRAGEAVATPMTPARRAVLEAIGARITAVRLPHPTRVGIDGVDASGKTTLGDELAEVVAGGGGQVVRASLDGFHRPREQRYRLGPDSPSGYYQDSFDYPALRRVLLDPLGPGGSRRYLRAVFDYRVEQPLSLPWEIADRGAVLIFDGVFLLRPELQGCWDLTVFLEVPFAEVLRRACRRDRTAMGSAAAVERRYRARYLPAQERYLEECRPSIRADLVMDNSNPSRPSLRAGG